MDRPEYYQTILSCMNEHVYVRDLDMNILYINPAAEKLTGWTMEESLGKKCYEVFGDENLECRDACPVEKTIIENSSVMHHEGELKTRNGDIRKMRVSISPVQEEDNVTGAIVVMQDITDFRALEKSQVKAIIKMEKMQESLKKSELNLTQAQAVASVGSWYIDIQKDSLSWSKETYRMFGIDEGTPLNTSIFFKKVHPEDRAMVESAWQEALNGKPYNIEHRISLNDEILWVHEKAQVVFDDIGEPLEAIGIVLDITERKRAVELLKESEQRFKGLFQQSNDAIFIHQEGKIIDVNESACELLGYGHDQLTKMSIPDFVPKKIKEKEEKRINFTNSVGSNIFESQLVRADGVTVDVEVSSSIINIEKKIIQSIARDITDRKKAEKALQESESNFRTFFNYIDNLLFILDDQGRIQEVNQTVIDRLGYSLDELKGQPVLVVHPEERREEAGQIVSEMLEGKRDYCPVPIITKKGDLIPVETYVSEGVWNGKPALYGISKDISLLKISEEKFSKAFHSNPAIAGISDLETGEYIEVNRTFYDKLGFTPEEVIGKRASEVVKMDLEFREKTLNRFQSQGYIKNEETIVYAKNGNPINVLLSAEFIELAGKKYNYTTAIDITERKQTEEQIAESLKEKEVLLREIHHRVKNNMQVIISLLRMHSRKSDDTGLRHIFNDCRDRINAMSLIHEALYQSEDLARIDFNEYLTKLCRNLRHAHDASSKGIDITLERCNVALGMDQSIAVGMVVAELISNAFKYAFPSSNEGSVLIRLSAIKGDEAELIIMDNGIGLPKEIDILNSPSLGLQLVFATITRELGGTIKVERDKGTRFIIRFKIKGE